jgi:hypothetical protein
MPVRMTELKWRTTILSIVLMVKFVSVECLNNTTHEGKLSAHQFPLRYKYKAGLLNPESRIWV